jgi:hypothetical protein
MFGFGRVAMDERAFWDIIARTREALAETTPKGLSQEDAQCEALTNILREMPLRDVVAFQWRAWRLSQEAYRWDLMRVALLIEGSCGDDGFAEFRWWLISLGESDFRRALDDPDHLAGIAHLGETTLTFFPLFGLVATDLYEQRSGREIPDDPTFQLEPIGGEKFAYEPHEMSKRFPGLWARFSKNCP